MNIISGLNVDLINPFPLGEARRVFGWNHCYRTLAENDDTPNDIEAFTKYIEGVVGLCPTWGIIDKNRITNANHEAPLVGILVFEPATLRHGYMHLATARKAFKTGLVDEAMELAIKQCFEEIPSLLRIGGYMEERNTPAKALFKRLGFKFEGLYEDMILRGGEAKNVVYFGLTKKSYLAPKLPLQEEAPVVDEISQPISA